MTAPAGVIELRCAFLKGGKRNFFLKGPRDGAEEACLAHNQEVAGSKPASANKFFNFSGGVAQG